MAETPGEQQLREALYDVVPDPPAAPSRAREARVLNGRLRRRRLVTGAALVVVAALAVPVVRSLAPSHDKAQELSGVVPTGSGPRGCHQLDRHGAGTTIDAQVIDRATASSWLSDIGSSWANRLGDGDSATVCVLAKAHQLRFTVTVLRPGRQPAVVATGDYGALTSTMTRLGAVQNSATPTTLDAPFHCPVLPQNDNVPLVGSARLPTGATAVRVCTDGAWYYPSEPLTSGVDDIVRAVNTRPLTYDRGSTCGGTPGAHGYYLVFRYPDGTRTVAADFCGWLGTGPVQRRDSTPSMADRVLAGLVVQESARGTTAPAPCPGRARQPMGRGDLTHVVAARFCPGGATGAGRLLSARELGRLRTGRGGGGTDSFGGWHTQIEQPCPAPTAGWPHLMLSDEWHEQFSVTLKCHNLRYWQIVAPTAETRTVEPVIIDRVTGLLRHLEATTPR